MLENIYMHDQMTPVHSLQEMNVTDIKHISGLKVVRN